MIRHSIFVCVVALGVAGTVAAEPVDYLKDVKPTLTARCFACHAALQQKADLRVDTVKAMIAAKVVVPGKSADSPLIAHALGKDGLSRMPPPSEGEALTERQIALLKQWIDEGAIAPPDEKPDPDPRDHWAFRAPVRPTVPGNAKNPVDAFLAAEWVKRGLKPQPPADKRLLLRRVYLDVTGLPPTPEEVDAFLKEQSPDAYEKLVDKLLASPQYGERWGRHFLDIWRYSDWWGLGAELRNSQKHIWHWRDWTVENLNADTGYDEMIRQMLAGDELYPTDPTKLRATGYLARTYFLFNRTTWLDETVEHVGKGFLGLTFNCTKCHDHKYDPISQNNYYQLRAFFEPYQVRTDMVPGEPDFEKNGIPRVFDCNADAPTYKHERGDERRPLTKQVIKPGLPALLAFGELKIEPVKLPAEAHSPQVRPWVAEAHRKAAEAKVSAAKAELAKAKSALADAEKRPAPPATPTGKPGVGKLVFKDDFAKPNPELWEVGPGMWKHERGRLVQEKPDGERSWIRAKPAIPTDFEATAKFVITGGNPYKSVGISFDAAAANEIMAYVSAGGSKTQVTYKVNGQHGYPNDAAKGMTIPTGKPIELTVRAKGPLVNVSVNGEHVIAYRLPIPRKEGKLELVTYSASAEFSSFELTSLPVDAVLITPSGVAMPAVTVQQAKADVAVAEKALALAEAEAASVTARLAADAGGDKVVAAKAEKLAALAVAEQALAKAVADMARVAPAQKAAAETKRKAAEAAVTVAKAAVEKPGDAYTPLRGAIKAKESNLEAGPSLTKPFPTTSTGRRTALANWIADRRNPLTARVLVNHVWLRHFGRPLVETIFDFGRKGAKPTHPELLDWLAVEFTEHNWSMKHLHRIIVTSQAYRMSSGTTGASENLKLESENRAIWRQNPIRMEAQSVRDSLLRLAGQLDTTISGPTVPIADQDASRRRSLYFFQSHNDHNKFLSQFDDANVLECYRRSESIVPQQALTLSNSKFAIAMTEAIAAKIQDRIGSKPDAEFVTAAFEMVLGCSPTDAERKACLEAMAEWTTELKAAKHADPSRKARTNLVGVLVNHNDFVTVR